MKATGELRLHPGAARDPNALTIGHLPAFFAIDMPTAGKLHPHLQRAALRLATGAPPVLFPWSGFGVYHGGHGGPGGPRGFGVRAQADGMDGHGCGFRWER